jgi:hypothetical protein
MGLKLNLSYVITTMHVVVLHCPVKKSNKKRISYVQMVMFR